MPGPFSELERLEPENWRVISNSGGIINAVNDISGDAFAGSVTSYSEMLRRLELYPAAVVRLTADGMKIGALVNPDGTDALTGGQVGPWHERPDPSTVPVRTRFVASNMCNAEYYSDGFEWRPVGGLQLIAQERWDIEYDYSAIGTAGTFTGSGIQRAPTRLRGGAIPKNGGFIVEAVAAECFTATAPTAALMAMSAAMTYPLDGVNLPPGARVYLGTATGGDKNVTAYEATKVGLLSRWEVTMNESAGAFNDSLYVQAAGGQVTQDYVSLTGDMDVWFQFYPYNAAGQNGRGRLVCTRLWARG